MQWRRGNCNYSCRCLSYLKARTVKYLFMEYQERDIFFMRLALEEAGLAFSEGEVPVGAVLADMRGCILSRAHNKKEALNDPTAHAEVMVLREGSGSSNTWRLYDAVLYVTKEPCVMCAGAMVNARLGRLVYGCSDPKGGAAESLYAILNDQRLNHQVEVVSGVLGDECAALLKAFFKKLR
jgi:tRNA(adenine34) deaminase